MKKYPSIPHLTVKTRQSYFGKTFAVYPKYDGSNLRAEWSPNKGWYKFGTRTQLLDPHDPVFGHFIKLFLASNIANKLPILLGGKRMTVFIEYMTEGAEYIAGVHDVNPDTKHLKLIDVCIHRKGFIPTTVFNSLDVDKAEPIEQFMLTTDNLWDVIKHYRYNHEYTHLNWGYPEGVVLKEVCTHQNPKRAKIKTQLWVDRIKELKGTNWTKYY